MCFWRAADETSGEKYHFTYLKNNLLMSSQPKKMVRKGLETLEIPSGIKNNMLI